MSRKQKLISRMIESLGSHTANFCKLWANRRKHSVGEIKHQIDIIRHCKKILSLKGI